MKAKPVLISVICLALGFAGGWLGRRQCRDSNQVTSGPVVTTTTPAQSNAPVSGTRAEPNRMAPEPLDPAKAQRQETTARLSILAGEKKRGLVISVPVFVFGNEGINPTFAKVYDLNPSEIAALNDAIKASRGKFTSIAIQTAMTERSADGSSLVIEVPTVVDQGGVIYDQLLHTFEGVLGADRFQSFNALSGESFDQGFGSFGLWSSRYEVSVETPATAKRPALYRVKQSSTGPNGSSNGTSSVYLKGLSTFYPVVSHFIEAGFEPKPGGK